MSDKLARDVTFPSSQPGGKPLAGYLVLPDGDGPFPGMIVVHEAFGLNENIRDITRRFAGVGYAALGVDLYSFGSVRPLCMAQVILGMLVNSLGNVGIHILGAALTYLQSLPAVDAQRMGVVGFCLGGSFSLAFACVDRRLRAASIFYALNPRPFEAVARACPIVGSYPEKDFTAPMGRRLAEALDRYGIPCDIKEYLGAHHSFFNDTRASYEPVAAEDSWRRTLAFFEQYVKS